MFTTQEEWNRGYADGRRYRSLGDAERFLLTGQVPAPSAGRALDVGCGVGELAAYLTSLGYTTDAADWSDHALADGAAHHPDVARWLRLDIEHDDWAQLHESGYDLITLRLVAAFLEDRPRVLRDLGNRLRPGGALVVITPLAAQTPAERRGTALDEDELGELHAGWPHAERTDADGLAFLVLRHSRPRPPAGAAARQEALAAAVREHHLGLGERSYAQVASGRKTVQVQVSTPEMADIRVGDTLVFHQDNSDLELDVTAAQITRYASFEELLDAVDPVRIDPDAAREDLLRALRAIYPPAKEPLGVLAFEFDHRPARPGRPMPLTPSQYAQTVPHHTVYGCLYIRDEHDRPIQLRSVYGSRLWQFPGGNLDAQGEDPLQTAQREAVEETGLELGLGTPTLLLAHFLHSGPRLPLNKVGFVFDGGRLTTDQLQRIRLDPAEHDMWAVHDMAGWQELMAPRAFARLDAVERARRGDGPAYLSTHT
ncbi:MULTISPECIES: methyltransferase domain-containing protein [unclassified Streptomyces]|uniref:methyltransferase domain-containing protein n=1 Tax=unclassified Streptomyces TaxID=2593676 RepID=UPI002E1778F6|nr:MULTISPECIES: methyltransferase domain-containing protein [unclassified Streptomyces]